MELQNNNSFSGQLNKTSIPYLLVYLQNNAQTGALDIVSKYDITIFLDSGIPYFAAGASSETLLGKILLNKNKITKYQYDRAVEEIKKDMGADHPMMRLVQGDVGSGKTVVALVACLYAVENQYQAAIMAPSQIVTPAAIKTLTMMRTSLSNGMVLSNPSDNLLNSVTTISYHTSKRVQVVLKRKTANIVQTTEPFSVFPQMKQIVNIVYNLSLAINATILCNK